MDTIKLILLTALIPQGWAVSETALAYPQPVDDAAFETEHGFKKPCLPLGPPLNDRWWQEPHQNGTPRPLAAWAALSRPKAGHSEPDLSNDFCRLDLDQLVNN